MVIKTDERIPPDEIRLVSEQKGARYIFGPLKQNADGSFESQIMVAFDMPARVVGVITNIGTDR